MLNASVTSPLSRPAALTRNGWGPGLGAAPAR